MACVTSSASTVWTSFFTPSCSREACASSRCRRGRCEPRAPDPGSITWITFATPPGLRAPPPPQNHLPLAGPPRRCENQDTGDQWPGLLDQENRNLGLFDQGPGG